MGREQATEREVPKLLRPYLSLGVHFETLEGTWVDAGCPFCGDERRKFAVNPHDLGRYKCVHCGATGNAAVQFCERYWRHCAAQTRAADLAALAAERGLLYPETVRAWGAVRSTLQPGTWLLPGYTPAGRVCQLYRYARDRESGRMVLKATAELPHGMFRPDDHDPGRGVVYQCEGPWDGMALWELFRRAKPAGGGGGGYEPTGNLGLSLAADNEVVAVPGVTASPPGWASACGGKAVVLAYDSDHPRERNGTVRQAGLDGVKRAARIYAAATTPPEEIHWLRWGPDGYAPDLKSGYDVRDWLTEDGLDLAGRLELLGPLLERVEPIPPDWVAGRARGAAPGTVVVPPRDCRDYATLVQAWRKALKWTPSLDRALSVMLAAVLSTPTVGEQLWVILMAPPSSAKTILCEAITLNRSLVFPTDKFTGLTSGYQVDKEGSQNLSLALKLHNKTLVINDGDTLLRLPNREEILSQLRTFYGRCIRIQHKNLMSKDIEGINCTVIIAGTGGLLELDAAELGARFITCDLGVMDDALQREVNRRAFHRAWNDLEFISDGKVETRDDPALAAAKALTAGYMDHLRVDPIQLMREVTADEAAAEFIQSVGEFVARMRCRPPKKQEEKVEKEMPFRLTKQYARLARCLAVVRNKTSVDAEVLAMIRQTVLDTAQGMTLNVCRALAAAGPLGLPEEATLSHCHLTPEKARKLLLFLRRPEIAVLENYTAPPGPGERVGRKRWRLTARMRELYEVVVAGGPGEGG